MGYAVEARGLVHTYGDGPDPAPILQDVSIAVKAGEFIAIVGPSGCGKTTLLNICAGLEPVQHGSVTVNGSAPEPGMPGTSYAFPDAALLPWRTAVQNVELGIRERAPQKAEKRARASAILDVVGLENHKDAYRSQLSQGMRQRVALARTLVGDPELLFLDEPFAALDAQTRMVMQDELARLVRPRDATVLLITHDLAEGVALADRVLIMSTLPGTIVADIPVDLPRPRSAIALRSNPNFHEIVSHIWSFLRSDLEASVSTSDATAMLVSRERSSNGAN